MRVALETYGDVLLSCAKQENCLSPTLLQCMRVQLNPISVLATLENIRCGLNIAYCALSVPEKRMPTYAAAEKKQHTVYVYLIQRTLRSTTYTLLQELKPKQRALIEPSRHREFRRPQI